MSINQELAALLCEFGFKSVGNFYGKFINNYYVQVKPYQHKGWGESSPHLVNVSCGKYKKFVVTNPESAFISIIEFILSNTPKIERDGTMICFAELDYTECWQLHYIDGKYVQKTWYWGQYDDEGNCEIFEKEVKPFDTNIIQVEVGSHTFGKKYFWVKHPVYGWDCICEDGLADILSGEKYYSYKWRSSVPELDF